jgi:hypothetical protein
MNRHVAAWLRTHVICEHASVRSKNGLYFGAADPRRPDAAAIGVD